MVLEGLRSMVGASGIRNLTAIVTMTDDGGSSGRLRKGRGVPPPGDVRNCIVALAAEKELLSGLFQYRYQGGDDLRGHSVGNLILTALAEQTGSFLRAVERSCQVLRTVGQVLPATLEDVILEAEFEDGTSVRGETAISLETGRIRRVRIHPASVAPTPGVIEAIESADLIVLSPGSLYTSLLPHMLIDGVPEAIRNSQALRVMIGNLVSEQGEAADLDLVDHLKVISDHAGGQVVDVMLVNDAPVTDTIRARYEEEGVHPLYLRDETLVPVPVIHRNLLARGRKLRHDPFLTAGGLLEAWKMWNEKRFSGARKNTVVAGWWGNGE